MLRVEHRMASGAVNRLRLWLLGVMLTTWPLLIGSLTSAGQLATPFGLTLIGVSAVLIALVVPLIPPIVFMDRVVELEREGVRMVAPVSPRLVPWSRFRRVRVVSGHRRGRPSVTFLLWGARATVQVSVDASKDPDAAGRVASAIVQFAPGLRRTGDVDQVRWDPLGRVDGSFSYLEPFEGPLRSQFTLMAALAALAMDLPVLVGSELFPTPPFRVWVAAIYLAIVVADGVLLWIPAATKGTENATSRDQGRRRWAAFISVVFAGLAVAILMLVAFG